MRLRLCTAFLLLATTLLGCPPESDDDDSDRTIEDAPGCSFPALANVQFTFTIHWFGEDYTQDALLDLMAEFDVDVFPFTFLPATITELGPDPDNPNLLAVTLTDSTPPPEGEDPPEDPNYVRIVYSLPLGYELPVSLEQAVASVTVLDVSSGDLVAAFGIWEEIDDGAAFDLLFLAEPSDLGMAFQPGDNHPLFSSVEVRDRQCGNLYTLPTGCASTYNLSAQFAVHDTLDEKGNVVAEGPSFELWPTEHFDFSLNDIEFRAVNVWSFTHREIDPECSNQYDFSAERFSYFVTRAASAPE